MKNVLLLICRFKEQQLGADEGSNGIVDLGAKQNDAVLEQTRIDVIGPFRTACGFNNHGDKRHMSLLARLVGRLGAVLPQNKTKRRP